MRPLFLITLLVSTAASAHFRFRLPDGGTIDELVAINQLGDPQKEPVVNGCPTGTASNIVTTLNAGQTYGVRIQETVYHPGHYRVAIAQNRATFPAPTATGNMCQSRTVPPVAAPVVLDGQLEHSAAFPGPQTITVTMPTTPGSYTLQVVEYMRDHALPCFYYHCANLNIVGGAGGGAGGGSGGASGTGGGVAAGGGSGTAGGSATGGSGGSGGGDAGGAGTAGGSSSGAGGGTTGGTGGTSGTGGSGVDDGGCTSAGGAASGGLAMLLALAALIRRRRI